MYTKAPTLRKPDPMDTWACVFIACLWIEVYVQYIFEDAYKSSLFLKLTSFLLGFTRAMLTFTTGLLLNFIQYAELDQNKSLIECIDEPIKGDIGFTGTAVVAVSFILLRQTIVRENLFKLFPGVSTFVENLWRYFEPVFQPSPQVACPFDNVRGDPLTHHYKNKGNISDIERQEPPTIALPLLPSRPSQLESLQSKPISPSRRREGQTFLKMQMHSVSEVCGNYSPTSRVANSKSIATAAATSSTRSTSRSNEPESFTPAEYEFFKKLQGEYNARCMTGKWVRYGRKYLQNMVAEAEEALLITKSSHHEDLSRRGDISETKNAIKVVEPLIPQTNFPGPSSDISVVDSHSPVEAVEPDSHVQVFQPVPPLYEKDVKPHPMQVEFVTPMNIVSLPSRKGKEREAGWAIAPANIKVPIVNLPLNERSFVAVSQPLISRPTQFIPPSISWNQQSASPFVVTSDSDMMNVDVAMEPFDDVELDADIEMEDIGNPSQEILEVDMGVESADLYTPFQFSLPQEESRTPLSLMPPAPSLPAINFQPSITLPPKGTPLSPATFANPASEYNSDAEPRHSTLITVSNTTDARAPWTFSMESTVSSSNQEPSSLNSLSTLATVASSKIGNEDIEPVAALVKPRVVRNASRPKPLERSKDINPWGSDAAVNEALEKAKAQKAQEQEDAELLAIITAALLSQEDGSEKETE